MGRVCYVPSLLWAEFVMCRVDPMPNQSSVTKKKKKLQSIISAALEISTVARG